MKRKHLLFKEAVEGDIVLTVFVRTLNFRYGPYTGVHGP